MKAWWLGVSLLALAGCADGKKDYESSARCQGMGHQAGTEAYDVCVREESVSRQLEQQRREFDQMKQEQQDWKLRRY